jgi:hypothetical protein
VRANRKTDVLEPEVGALVRHPLVADAELARLGFCGGGSEAGGGEGITDIGRGHAVIGVYFVFIYLHLTLISGRVIRSQSLNEYMSCHSIQDIITVTERRN